MYVLIKNNLIVGISDGSSPIPSDYQSAPLPPDCSLNDIWYNPKTNKVERIPQKPDDESEYTWVNDHWQRLIPLNNSSFIPDDGLLEQEPFKSALSSDNPVAIKWLMIALYADSQQRYPLIAKCRKRLNDLGFNYKAPEAQLLARKGTK